MTSLSRKNKQQRGSLLRDDNLPPTHEKLYLRAGKQSLLDYSILKRLLAIELGLHRTGFQIVLSSG